MKKHLIVIGMVVLLLVVGLSGCLTSGADVKITSVNISKNHPDYTFTIKLKNVGDEGDHAIIEIYLYERTSADVWSLVNFNDYEDVYMDKGDATTVTLTVKDKYNADTYDETIRYLVEVEASTESGKMDAPHQSKGYTTYIGTDVYSKEFYSD